MIGEAVSGERVTGGDGRGNWGEIGMAAGHTRGCYGNGVSLLADNPEYAAAAWRTACVGSWNREGGGERRRGTRRRGSQKRKKTKVARSGTPRGANLRWRDTKLTRIVDRLIN